MFETPILFLIFNRPDTTQIVFDEIKKQKPKYLYVAADGPRVNKQGEAEKCEKTRAILKQIDWDCELKTLFRPENLGCGKAVSSAITWFFENVEQGIILEDDCLPHADFFEYCETLLERYKDNTQIKIICGDTPVSNPQDKYSYRYSRDAFIWGWAAWKRTWEEYSYSLDEFTIADFKKAIYSYFPFYKRLRSLNMFILLKTFAINPAKVHVNTWDGQLLISIWMNNGVNIVPSVNLISNIGFGSDATHLNTKMNKDANKEIFSILPLTHPEVFIIQKDSNSITNYGWMFVKNSAKFFKRMIKWYIVSNAKENT